ncbi:MAG: ABC transporter permease [Caldilineaceae bacterium]|nr:ABC transporter permease [Caldilineaceae bacterium]
MITTTTLGQRSFFSELHILGVMARKEWIIFRRYPTWFFAFLIWPLIFPLGSIFTARALSGPNQAALPAFAARAGTDDYVAYIVIGLTMYMWINITLWDVGFQLRNEQMRGTLESNWLCPIWRFSILVGPSLTKLLTSLVFTAIAVLEYGLLLGNWVGQGNIALVLLIMLLVIPSIYGIGVIFGSLVMRFQEAHTMVFLVRGIFMIFTGVSYPLSVMPAWMQSVAAWLPLTYAIQAIRAVTLNQATFLAIRHELTLLALFAIVLSALGYGIFRFTEGRARRTGSLGRY